VDPTKSSFKTTEENGSVFRVVCYEPGVTPRNHRTDSIDYAVVLSGEIEMELDDGVIVKLRAGDLLVQRGSIHNWVNRGKDDCIIAFVLISAHPVSAAGKPLDAIG
jgi:quercetin dioxygenase-like cupin family protein